MNKRLGVENQSISQLAALAASKNTSLSEVMAIVEEDGWVYTQPDGESFVCSAFTAAMYKAGGLLPDDVEATEFVPRDVYMLDIFDKEFEKPQICTMVDPELPYCQILGKYRIDIREHYSILEPYAHMDERCPSVNPDYARPDDC